MKNVDIAKAYLKDAEIIVDEARESLQKAHYHRVVRKCQESVELALKELLRLKGIEYPKAHKLGMVLLETLGNELDAEFVQKAADIADQLAIDREPSFYGSEDAAADKLFDKDDAENSIDNAGYVISFIKSLLQDK